MHFIDEAKIFIKAGDGGNGCIGFRREKFVPKGGPDGGSGGNGGNVIVRANKQLTTLLDFRYKKTYKAENGDAGRGKKMDGKWGKDLILQVPCGTLVKEADNGTIISDLVHNGDEVIVAKGGKGGKGNTYFATSTNQAPRIAEPGTPGTERDIVFELKLLADVGLVGFPNAGKSTLISVISAAKPKIADYPFTTLVPNLGIVRYADGKGFIVADIPGLIEGAHYGKGLGIQFLRHIERTKVLVFLIDATSNELEKDYSVLVNELREHNAELPQKRKIIALTKIDLLSNKEVQAIKKIKFGRGTKSLPISAVASTGLKQLLDEIWKLLAKEASSGS